MLDPLNNLNTPCALALFLGSMDTTAKRLTRVRSYPYRLQFPVAPLFIARVFSALVPQDLGARPGGNMIGPCDEGDATGRGQPVESTFDPLEPTIDVALNDFGRVWSQYPKVPRTTWHASKRVGYNERLLAIGSHLRRPC